MALKGECTKFKRLQLAGAICSARWLQTDFIISIQHKIIKNLAVFDSRPIVGHDQDSYRVVEWRVLVYCAVLPTVDWCRYVLSAPEVMIVYRYLHRSPTPPDRIPHQLARMFAVGSTPSPAVRHPDVCSRSVAQGAPGESLGKVRPIWRKLRMSAVWSVDPRQGSDTQFLRRQWDHSVLTSKVYHGYIMLWLSKQNTYRNVVPKTYLSFFLCFIYMF